MKAVIFDHYGEGNRLKPLLQRLEELPSFRVKPYHYLNCGDGFELCEIKEVVGGHTDNQRHNLMFVDVHHWWDDGTANLLDIVGRTKRLRDSIWDMYKYVCSVPEKKVHKDNQGSHYIQNTWRNASYHTDYRHIICMNSSLKILSEKLGIPASFSDAAAANAMAHYMCSDGPSDLLMESSGLLSEWIRAYVIVSYYFLGNGPKLVPYPVLVYSSSNTGHHGQFWMTMERELTSTERRELLLAAYREETANAPILPNWSPLSKSMRCSLSNPWNPSDGQLVIPVHLKRDSLLKRAVLAVHCSLEKWYNSTSHRSIELYEEIARTLAQETASLTKDNSWRWWCSSQWDAWCCLRQCFYYYMVLGGRPKYHYQYWKAAFDMIDEMLLCKTFRDFPIVIHFGEKIQSSVDGGRLFEPQYVARNSDSLDSERKLVELVANGGETEEEDDDDTRPVIFSNKNLAEQCSEFFKAKARRETMQRIETTTHEFLDEHGFFEMKTKKKLAEYYMNDNWRAMVVKTADELLSVRKLAEYLVCDALLASCDAIISEKRINLEVWDEE